MNARGVAASHIVVGAVYSRRKCKRFAYFGRCESGVTYKRQLLFPEPVASLLAVDACERAELSLAAEFDCLKHRGYTES
jgi:hypothetical protein